MRTLNVIQVVENWPMMVDASSDSNFVYSGAIISCNALTILLKNQGWEFDDTIYNQSEEEMPEFYDVATITGKRFMARYYPNNVKTSTFLDVYTKNGAKKIPWSGNSTNQ